MTDIAITLERTNCCSKAIFETIVGRQDRKARPTASEGSLRTLIDAGAFVDAAMAMIRLELPAFAIRKIEFDDGLWYCRLSRACQMPADIDDGVDGFHSDLALAILAALVEAKRLNTRRTTVPSAGTPTSPGHIAMCCENFA